VAGLSLCMIPTLFWCSLGLVLYAYFGYPSVLMAIAAIRNRRVRRRPNNCAVTFIITAYNEAARIAAKIENTLAQNYQGPLEIIVASDYSSDGTDDIVRAFAPRVRLVRAAERRGKEAAQQLAVQVATGEILVFSDVATALAPDAVATITENFADPTVGCVSSIDRFVDADGRVSGEGAYVRYEMFLRALETRVNTLVGLSGSFFAARRTVCRDWASDRQSDFNTLLNSVRLGLRGVLDPLSVGYYRPISDPRCEFQRKVRTVVRGIGVFAASVPMLNPLRYGLFAWQLASHKLCRWLAPWAMIGAFVTNAWLATESFWWVAIFGAQLGFYAAIAGGGAGNRSLRIPYYFFVANLAILIAWLRYARGDRMVSWNPSERPASLPQVSCAFDLRISR
jgi:glycosyltransferase involved in cell wall biosynthesis